MRKSLLATVIALMAVASAVPIALVGALSISQGARFGAHSASQVAHERALRLSAEVSARLAALVREAAPEAGAALAFRSDPAGGPQSRAVIARPGPDGAESPLALEPLSTLLAERAGDERIEVYVVDRAGLLVADRDASPLGQTRAGRPAVRLALQARPDAPATAVPSEGGERIASWAAIPGTPWMLVVEQPSEQALALGREMTRILLVGLALALLLAVGLSAYFARRVLGPLRALSQTALEIAGGKFGVSTRVAGTGEIGKLAEVFNYMSQQLLAYDGETRRLYQSLEEGYLQTMLALASVIDSKDSYTLGHSQRVGEWAAEIGREMRLPELAVRHLLYGGILHDVGKIGVVEPILCKRSRLTDEEMDAMKGHPVIGASIIGGVTFLKPVLPAVRHHHERWDGSGYPDGLIGEAIPLIARIVAAADIWDACTSIRPYQKAMPAAKALEIMHKFKGTQLDPQVVDALERVVRRKQAKGELVSAGDGGTAAPPKAAQDA